MRYSSPELAHSGTYDCCNESTSSKSGTHTGCQMLSLEEWSELLGSGYAHLGDFQFGDFVRIHSLPCDDCKSLVLD
jgi:hypothetical protein